MDKHPCHRPEIAKLNRAAGQISGIKTMIEEGRYCPEILTQLRAVQGSLKSIELNILEKHLEHCVVDTIQSKDKDEISQRISEMKTIIKRFQ